MKGLTLSEREQTRLEILNRVRERGLSVREASVLLGLGERHTWRILAAYRKDGAAALAHGNRGRPAPNAVRAEVRAAVVQLATTRYVGLNHSHLAEVLEEREGIVCGRSTVRSILVQAGVQSPRQRRPPRHRVRRQRLPQEGMLLQIDGSAHAWLEGRGPKLTLLLALDDATGTAPGALFRQEEDAVGYFLLLREILHTKGVPLALYSDRHAVFRPTRAVGVTQFGRAMQELGVTQVFALSPQAKGRIERANGTFQDRLCSELRLAGACTAAEANQVLAAFLPRFNRRFGVPAAEPGCAYRTVAADVDVASILAFKEWRKVAHDNTIKVRWRTLQLLPGMERLSYAGVQVEVQHRLDGSLVVCHAGQALATQEAPPRPAFLRPLPPVAAIPLVAPAWEQTRSPTPKQRARWEAVQAAMLRGLGVRAIARELGIASMTASKYMHSSAPRANAPRRIRALAERQVDEHFSKLIAAAENYSCKD